MAERIDKESIEEIAKRMLPEVGPLPDRDIIERKIEVAVVTEKLSGKFVGVFGSLREYAGFVMGTQMVSSDFEERYDVWDCDISIDIRVQTIHAGD